MMKNIFCTFVTYRKLDKKKHRDYSYTRNVHLRPAAMALYIRTPFSNRVCLVTYICSYGIILLEKTRLDWNNAPS